MPNVDSAFGKGIAAMVRRAANTSRGSRVLDTVLTDDIVVGWVNHRLGATASRSTPPIDEAMPVQVGGGFETLVWLFTPSPAARGISQLLLDEAVYLYNFVQGLTEPRVAEVGRWKGGTTFFLAAAGANVESFDIEDARHRATFRNAETPPFRESLERALDVAGLRDRVELVKADATTWDVTPGIYDLVYLDILVKSVAEVSELFERWWVGLRPGGRLVLREGGSSKGHQTAFVATLAERGGVRVEAGSPGVFAVITPA
jgi:SAM-dependent methyltransferase